MPAKFKKKFKSEILKGKAKKVTDEMKNDFARRVKLFIKTAVIDSIEKGVSPVNMKDAYPKNTGGKSRYGGYSSGYINRMKNADDMYGKKQRPVNLTLSGKMLRSLKSKIIKGKVKLWFTDEKAKYHDKLGAGKSKVFRRLLPRGIEEFNRAIQLKINEAASESVRDLL